MRSLSSGSPPSISAYPSAATRFAALMSEESGRACGLETEEMSIVERWEKNVEKSGRRCWGAEGGGMLCSTGRGLVG